MSNNHKPFKRGDILLAKQRTRNGHRLRPCIVVQNNTGNYHSDTLVVVWMSQFDQHPMPTHCKVYDGMESNALCEQISSIEKTDVIKKFGHEYDMKNVNACLRKELGL